MGLEGLAFRHFDGSQVYRAVRVQLGLEGLAFRDFDGSQIYRAVRGS